jgi:hypothetical protein
MPHERKSSSDSEFLDVLKGSVLASVEFVRDYAQLRFDGPCLTVYYMPHVQSGGVDLAWGQKGYCDALCACIGHKVEDTKVTDEEIIVVINQTVLRIGLLDNEYGGRGPEAIMFENESGKIWVV